MTQTPTSSIRFTKEDRAIIEEAKKLLSVKGIKITATDAIRAALNFFVDKKKQEQKVKK